MTAEPPLPPRRRFLAAAAAATAGAGLAAPALAQATARATLVGAFPRGFPGVGVNAERLAQRITALSDGRLEVSYFGGGELVPPFGVFDAVASGAAQFGHTAPYYAVGQVRSSMYFTAFPYGLTALELAGWIRFGGGQALWDEAYAPYGVKPFYAGNSGAQAGGWFRNPISSLDDLQGLKMRIGGLGGEVMQKLGVTTVLTPPAEIFPALQSGVVDAAEFVGPWNDIAFGLHQIAPYYYMPAFHEPGAGLECIVNMAFFDGLSPHLRGVVETAAAATAEETHADFHYHNARVFKQLVALGVKPSAFPEDVVAALGAASREVIEAYPGDDALAQRVHASYFEFVRECAAYGGAMEARVYGDRARVWSA
ncbi:TRAP transporter substrate-binding protein [Rubrimonas cliftonensis]|uniref:TRAP-type mannitol/chloroaromatic compound transport system, substrate-binding protein n=1 Tax=Rubrimonas cliftonensis TaxID=89524 RepID=A0A1H4A5H4_9RHOB|nr:TRAP transporter substrate-binding protein [Rubrimonas cliftonensis]SEA31058.1 TRAP-type mannitol/chloroaromatic compound transport system, substrate-binding protein [Rubrimonas cliftonensis]